MGSAGQTGVLLEESDSKLNEKSDNDEYDLMTLQEIEIHGLFHQFDYVFPLFVDARVSLIYGMNGSGKTTILKLLEAVAKANWFYLMDIPFDAFILRFDEGVVEIKKELGDEEIISLNVSWKFGRKKKRAIVIQSKHTTAVADTIKGGGGPVRFSKAHGLTYEEYRFLRGLRRTERGKDSFAFLNEGFNLWDEKDYLMAEALLNILQGFPDSKKARKDARRLLDALALIPCRLLPATRLWEEDEHKDRVEKYAEELKNKLSEVKDRFTRKSQSLDYIFPKKVLEWTQGERITTKDGLSVSEAKIKVEGKYHKLVKAGLLQEEEALVFTEPEVKDMQEKLSTVFAAHYDNLDSKLEVFDSLYENISLLIRTVDMFYGDTMKIKADYEHGLVAIPKDISKPIQVTSMSSGQQHILILAYHLIFEAIPEQLVMIDEPELSLHTAWQAILVERFKEIGSRRNLQFILATHSSLIYQHAKDSSIALKAFR